MDFSFLKNPIVLAIIAMALTYAYMYWENKKKKEENPKANIEEVTYTTPIIVGILTLFITHSFFTVNANNVNPSADPVGKVIENSNMPKLTGGAASNDILNQSIPRMTDTFNSETYHLVGRNTIKLPQTDVFIDIAKF